MAVSVIVGSVGSTSDGNSPATKAAGSIGVADTAGSGEVTVVAVGDTVSDVALVAGRNDGTNPSNFEASGVCTDLTSSGPVG